jgi:hypothetical protein
MAGAGAKLFTSGSVLTADQVNTFLMDQSIMRFTSTTTRDAAFGGAGEPTLAEGMFAYTTDTNTLWLYNGSSWVNVLGSDIGEISTDNRNVIINGAMQIAQRGTSATGLDNTNSSYHTADRWRLGNIGPLGTWTQSLEADAPTGSGFRNSVKMLCTTADASPAAGDLLLFNNRSEGQNVQRFLKGTSSAKPFALSFWVKSNVTGTYIAELFDNDNTRQVSASYTISASATWEKKTITFPADTTGAFDNDNASSLAVNFWLGAGTTYTSGTLNTTWASNTDANRAVGQTNVGAAINNYWQITGVQLEVGSVATPFEFEDISTTLAKCQRYYQRWQANATDQDVGIGQGFASSTTSARIYIPLRVTMRTKPSAVEFATLSANSITAGYAVTAVSLVASVNNPEVGAVTITATNMTANVPIFLNVLGSATGYFAFTAEL